MDTDNTPWRFSIGPHKLFAQEYLAEIREFSKAAALPEFEQLAMQFSHYQQYLESRKELVLPSDRLMKISNQTGIIDTSINNPTIQHALASAHIASACHLLHSSNLPLPNLQSTTLLSLAKNFVNSCEHKPEEYRRRLVNKFHTIDTIRIIQFLRHLGLVTRSSEEFYQLGIGAADGTRDILSLHLIPRINISVNNNVKFISLHADQKIAAETIIIDSEPLYKEHYSALNEDKTVNAIAYNNDTIQVLKDISDEMTQKRNLITGLRIDHRMLPDVNEFFHYLAPCISDDCDFILTIGAGDTDSDFKGRIDKFTEIFSVLEKSGLRPFLFKLHGTGSIAKQQKSLYFGNVRASSYEILYCKLDTEILSRAL